MLSLCDSAETKPLACWLSIWHEPISTTQDTYNHLWDRSRPTIVEMERKVKRKKEKVIISTEIESLVESLFLEEGEEWTAAWIHSVGILCLDGEI